jgi:hypothetical protein
MDNEQDNKNNMKDKLIQWIGIIFFVWVFLYGAPAIIILIVNFFKLVVFGDWKMSEFSEFNEYYGSLSWGRVNLFYKHLFDWFSTLVNRLQS